MYCGEECRVEDDHPSLRDANGRPYDADFVFGACASCNKTRWHAFRLASEGRYDVHPAALRLAATSFFITTFADANRELTLTVAQQRALAQILLDGAIAIVTLLGVVVMLACLLGR